MKFEPKAYKSLSNHFSLGIDIEVVSGDTHVISALYNGDVQGQVTMSVIKYDPLDRPYFRKNKTRHYLDEFMCVTNR